MKNETPLPAAEMRISLLKLKIKTQLEKMYNIIASLRYENALLKRENDNLRRENERLREKTCNTRPRSLPAQGRA